MSLRLGIGAVIVAMMLAGCTNRPTTNLPQPTTRMASLMEEGKVPTDMLRIGSWNMAWLGPSNHTPAEKRSPDDLAQYIARSGAAVISLQLVGQSPGSGRRNRTLDSVSDVLKREGQGDWGYLLFPTQSPDQSACTGVMWNRRLVAVVGEPYAIAVPRNLKGLDETVIWERLPHAVKFASGKNDFVVIPVHTRAGLVGESDSSNRVHEIRLLAGQLEAVRRHFSDNDLILAGDFNTNGSGETTVVILTKAGFKDLNSSDELTYISGAPFDRAFVPNNQPEFARTKQIRRVPSPGMSLDEFRRKLSDHFLITFDMRMSGDDD